MYATRLVPVLFLGLGITTASAEPAAPAERIILDAAVKLQVEPEYPPAARAAQQQGKVRLGMIIDRQGLPTELRILASDPAGVFDGEALATAKYWRFTPAWEVGACVRHPQRAELEFGFRLVDGKPVVDTPPPVIDGIVATDRPVVRARNREDVRDALASVGWVEPLADVVAEPVERVEPLYPRQALLERRGGYAILRFTVTAEGGTSDVKVTESEPGTLFDDVSIKALRRWRFQPRMVDGRPVPSTQCQTITYQISPG